MGITIADITKDVQTRNDMTSDVEPKPIIPPLATFDPNAQPTDAEIASLATTISNDPELETELEEEIREQSAADVSDAGLIDNPTLEDEKEILDGFDDDDDEEGEPLDDLI